MIFSLFGWLKKLLVPKGSFGYGPNSKITEIVALIVITSLLSLGLYWALIFFFIFLKTGQLTNISTTIALYSRLEVPSMTICSLPHVSTKDSILEAYKNRRLRILLMYKNLNRKYYSFYPKIRPCSWEDSKEPAANGQSDMKNDHCLCIDMWKQTFYEKDGSNAVKPPFFLFHISPTCGFDLDSISVAIKYLKPKARTKNDTYCPDYSIISNILKIGIYDHPMIIARQYSDSVEPSWFYSNIGNTAQVSLKLLKNYVFDVEKFYFYIFKGYVSRQENEYEIVVSQKNTHHKTSLMENQSGKASSMLTINKVPYWIKLINRTYIRNQKRGYNRSFSHSFPNLQGDQDSNREEFETASFTRFHFTFRDFSVTEVFRLSGASVVASFLTLMVVCVSAFNKQLIYELLFPYYEDRNAKMTVTSLATLLSFGYVRKYRED